MHKPLLLSLVLLATVFAGCSDSGGSTPPDDIKFDDDLKATKDTGLIRGVVVDASITPIAGVLVSLEGQEASTESDAEGRFSFGDLPGGTYFITAEKPGYFPVQQSIEVVAGVDRPDAVKVLLEADAAFNPYYVEEVYDGFIECTSSLIVLCGAPHLVLCGLDIHCDPITNDRYTPTIAYEEDPAWIQTEMVWQSTQPAGEQLYLEVETEDAADFITGIEGPSPVLVQLDQDVITAFGLGGEGGGIYYSVFSGDATGTGYPIGVTLQQEIQLFFHSFYGYTPPEDWRFTNGDGVPQPPS